jgi:hypothetical protein
MQEMRRQACCQGVQYLRDVAAYALGGGCMIDPQENLRKGMWMTHDGLIFIEDMNDEYVLNAYKTCKRHGNPKADELWREMERRNIDWRVK